MATIRIVTLASALTAIYGGAVYAQSPSVMDLPRAKGCSEHSNFATAGRMLGTTDITMSNDGGWCWMDLSATQGSLQYLPTYRVSKAPVHGQVVMGAVGMKARIAFKPEAGFAGSDTYTLMNTLNNSERVVTITITR
jgi:hypothetical protein